MLKQFALMLCLFVVPSLSTAEEPSPPIEKVAAPVAWGEIQHGALLVDVRSAEEFAKGHLEGAINVPHTEVASRLSEFGADKGRQIVVYCRSGRRSGIAREVLMAHGFSKVSNAGGYEDLLAAKP